MVTGNNPATPRGGLLRAANALVALALLLFALLARLILLRRLRKRAAQPA
jgi:hypothetical protein